MNSAYHSGEIAVQHLAGSRQMAEQNAKSVRSSIPKVAADFLHGQTMLIVGSTDAHGRVWTSLLQGPPNFIGVENEQTVTIHALPRKGDPLTGNLQTTGDIGILAIEFLTRRRMRLNGKAEAGLDGMIRVTAEEVYSNCPKYIQSRRSATEISVSPAVHDFRISDRLSETQQAWIRNADTCFIASSNLQRKTDASHRGGYPGFIAVEEERTVLFPDYPGNGMFNTLGNIYENPRVGLLFVDFAAGHTLQLTGKAAIIWDEEKVSRFSGAERAVEFELEEAIEISNKKSVEWEFIEYSPFNPR